MADYKIKNILNNNVVLVESDNQNYILVGKGIGFGNKKGAVLKDSREIEKRFISLEGLTSHKYQDFLAKVDPKIIEISQKILAMVSAELGVELDPKMDVGLIDHLNFLLKRLKEDIEIINPFLDETQLLYPVEFQLAEKGVKILEEELEVSIPRAEIGFLTLHIYGGRGNRSKEEALRYSKLMNQILRYVERKLEIQIDKNSFEYRRFIMHLRGVLKRVTGNKEIKSNIVSQLEGELRVEFKLAYDISKIMENSLKIKIPESEIGYIALHLHKLKNRNI